MALRAFWLEIGYELGHLLAPIYLKLGNIAQEALTRRTFFIREGSDRRTD
jgi:hypothetical protein